MQELWSHGGFTQFLRSTCGARQCAIVHYGMAASYLGLRQSTKVESEILLVGSYFKYFPFQLLVLFWETVEPLEIGT